MTTDDAERAAHAHVLTPRARWTSAWLRRIPARVPGKTRGGQWLLRAHLNARDVIVSDGNGNHFVFPSLAEPMALHLLVGGSYEPDVLAAARAQLDADSCVVDVGANIGLFTVAVARYVPRGRVMAIEAAPALLPYLRANVARNQLDNVVVHGVAASGQAHGMVPFYNAPLEQFGMGSLAPQFHAAPVSVPTAALDALLAPEEFARVRVLKIDVEGFEAAVLRGAQNLLTQPKPPLVLFEFADWAEARAEGVGAAQRVLRDWGYLIWELRAWLQGKPPRRSIRTEGYAMLIAQRGEGSA